MKSILIENVAFFIISLDISPFFVVTLTSPKLLSLGKAEINLAFPSLIRNFAPALITQLSKLKGVWECGRRGV